MHLVHKAAGEKYLVIGIFLMPVMQGRGNKFFRHLFENRFEPNHVSVEMGNDMADPYASLLKPRGEFYSYLGSLTIPPCTPNVEWISMMKPVEIDQDNFDGFEAFLKSPRANQ